MVLEYGGACDRQVSQRVSAAFDTGSAHLRHGDESRGNASQQCSHKSAAMRLFESHRMHMPGSSAHSS